LRTLRREARFHDLGKIHFAADFIFEIQLFLAPACLSALESPQRQAHSPRQSQPDLRFGQKLDIAGERIVLIFDHTECAQHTTSANKRKAQTVPNFGLCGVLQSEAPRLLNAAAQSLPVRKTAPEISSSSWTRLSSWMDRR